MSVSATLALPVHHSQSKTRRRGRSPHTPIRVTQDHSAACFESSCAAERGGRPSDEELLTRYRDLRRSEDFAELVRRFSGGLGLFLRRYLDDAALAQDVLQDTFLQVYSKCDLYRDGWPARSWLYSIATHRAIDALRRYRRLPAVRLEQPLTDDSSAEAGSLLEVLSCAGQGPLEVLQERDRQRWVRDSVARLPEPMRQVLVLAYYEEMSYAEIAELLEVPLGTVKSRLHGAIARLREMAKPYARLECL